jgi:hypothetical protein
MLFIPRARDDDGMFGRRKRRLQFLRETQVEAMRRGAYVDAVWNAVFRDVPRNADSATKEAQALPLNADDSGVRAACVDSDLKPDFLSRRQPRRTTA